MFTIEKAPYGLHLIFKGHFPKDEANLWARDAKEAFLGYDGEFCVFVDMREMELMPPESRQNIVDVQRTARKNGMIRSVIILKDKITTLQLKGIAKETGIYEWERYIDADAELNWEEIGLDWIINSVDPDDYSRQSEHVNTA